MKRRIVTALTAAAVSSAALGAAVYAAEKYTADDLKGMRDSLLGEAPVKAEQDLNSDGRVDVFDMIRMRRELVSTGEFVQSSFPVTEDHVKYVGRDLYKDGTLWLVQSGSAVEFTVNARSASVTLKGDSSISNGEEHRPRYAVIVDGEIISDATMGKAEETVELFSGTSPRSAEVKIIHLSEANNGAVGVSEIKADSNAAAPVRPVKEKDLRIEFIGDSITCAYGVEGESQYENFKTTTENFMKSYAYLTAQKLGAEYSAVSYSGHGIVSGYSSDGTKVTGQLVPPYYENYGSMKDYATPWDFSAKPNDVVVINLGTNDATYIDKDPETRGPEFTQEYEKFLETVRKNNPDAYIICTLGIMGCTDEYPMIEQAVADFREATGDTRIMSYQSPVQSTSDGYGSDWHPSAVTQQKNAYILSDKICQALGLESDQIGLDVAADAEYSISYGEGSGANASTFFSDYDKSFWVNMVSGGSSPEDVQAVISGIGLKKGGKYRLTLECTSAEGEGGKTSDHEVFLRSADGSQVYYSGTLVNSGAKSPFEAEFTVDSDDPDAQIAVYMGGINYRSVTLYNVKLEKIG